MDDNQIQLKSIPTLPGVYQFKNKIRVVNSAQTNLSKIKMIKA